jgi:hypothetical protein
MDSASLILLFQLILICFAPTLGLLLLIRLMNRWGRKHDPLGGEPGLNHYSTMGTGEGHTQPREDQRP